MQVDVLAQYQLQEKRTEFEKAVGYACGYLPYWELVNQPTSGPRSRQMSRFLQSMIDENLTHYRIGKKVSVIVGLLLYIWS